MRSLQQDRTFTNRLNINVKGFSSVEFEGLFRRFGEWLLSFSGPHNAALRINVHYKFFERLRSLGGEYPVIRIYLVIFPLLGSGEQKTRCVGLCKRA